MLGKAPGEQEEAFSVQGPALLCHLGKLVFSPYTNSHPSTSPNRPIVGIWLRESRREITVGGPSGEGTLAVACEATKHTRRVF